MAGNTFPKLPPAVKFALEIYSRRIVTPKHQPTWPTRRNSPLSNLLSMLEAVLEAVRAITRTHITSAQLAAPVASPALYRATFEAVGATGATLETQRRQLLILWNLIEKEVRP